MKFLIRRSADGLWFWIARSSNGRTLATSETFKRRAGALKSIAAMRAMLDAPIEEAPQ